MKKTYTSVKERPGERNSLRMVQNMFYKKALQDTKLLAKNDISRDWKNTIRVLYGVCETDADVIQTTEKPVNKNKSKCLTPCHSVENYLSLTQKYCDYSRIEKVVNPTLNMQIAPSVVGSCDDKQLLHVFKKCNKVYNYAIT